MAKYLLRFFVIATMLNSLAAHYLNERLTEKEYGEMWIAIAILAICESIEKRDNKSKG